MNTTRFLRMPEVRAEVGLSRATIYRMIATDDFPAPHQLSARCVGWWSSEIENWKTQRRARRA